MSNSQENTIRRIVVSMLFVEICLIYTMLNFLASRLPILDALTNFCVIVNFCAIVKIFVAMCFVMRVATAFLEGLQYLHMKRFSTTKVSAIRLQTVESKADAEFYRDLDLELELSLELERAIDEPEPELELKREIELELELAFNRQWELELELDLEREIRQDHERQLTLLLGSSSYADALAGFDFAGAVATVSTESATSDADFFAEQQRAIQDALGYSSLQITWGDLDSTPTADVLADSDVPVLD